MAEASTSSMLGKWEKIYEGLQERKLDANGETARKAFPFLHPENIQTIEDWGSGGGGAQSLIREGQEYKALDGSSNKFVDEVVDLREYSSSPDGIFLRHVLEHNPEWPRVLYQALQSFQKRMVLIISTPWAFRTKVIREYEWHSQKFQDWSFQKSDLYKVFSLFPQVKVVKEECNLKTASQYNVEHIIYLEKLS